MTIETMTETPAPPPIACNLNHFDAAQSARYAAVTATLGGAIRSIEVLPNGVALILSSTPEICVAAMEFVTLERLCCGFLTFRFELAPAGGPLTLSLTGPEGTTDALGDFVEKMRRADGKTGE